MENGEYVMLVEIKTEPSVEDVNDHLERITIVRVYMDTHNDRRKIVGTIAGGIIPENVLRYAHRKGLFAVMQNGESVTVAETPPGFTAREW